MLFRGGKLASFMQLLHIFAEKLNSLLDLYPINVSVGFIIYLFIYLYGIYIYENTMGDSVFFFWNRPLVLEVFIGQTIMHKRKWLKKWRLELVAPILGFEVQHGSYLRSESSRRWKNL